MPSSDLIFPFLKNGKICQSSAPSFCFLRPNFHPTAPNEVLAFQLRQDENRGGVAQGHSKASLKCPLCITRAPIKAPSS